MRFTAKQPADRNEFLSPFEVAQNDDESTTIIINNVECSNGNNIGDEGGEAMGEASLTIEINLDNDDY